MLRLWRATINTRNGLAFAIRSEQAVREELLALTLSVPLAWLVGASVMRRVELVAAVAFVLVMVLCVRPAVAALLRRVRSPQAMMAGLVIGAVAVAAIAQQIDLHPMIGAFLFGTLIPRTEAVAEVSE